MYLFLCMYLFCACIYLFIYYLLLTGASSSPSSSLFERENGVAALLLRVPGAEDPGAVEDGVVAEVEGSSAAGVDPLWAKVAFLRALLFLFLSA